jgi:hypothetical protein
MFTGFRNTEFEFHASDKFDLSAVIRNGEASRDDVVEINHCSGDDVRPF